MKISNFRLGIGLPLSFHMIPSAFFDSFITMEKPPFTYLRTSNGSIDDMRNNIVRDALQAGCSHLIMMDTDQVYHQETIPKLLSHKLPMVGTLVYRRYPPFDPLMLKGEIGKYKTIDQWEPGSLVEVDATGTGCLLFSTEIFKKMPPPWFRFRRVGDKPVGEDIGFCSDMRKAGYKIYVDTSVPAGHLSQIQITETTWRRYRQWESKMAVEHNTLKAAEPN